jgi:hypothetical protein
LRGGGARSVMADGGHCVEESAESRWMIRLSARFSRDHLR